MFSGSNLEQYKEWLKTADVFRGSNAEQYKEWLKTANVFRGSNAEQYKEWLKSQPAKPCVNCPSNSTF